MLPTVKPSQHASVFK